MIKQSTYIVYIIIIQTLHHMSVRINDSEFSFRNKITSSRVLDVRTTTLSLSMLYRGISITILYLLSESIALYKKLYFIMIILLLCNNTWHAYYVHKFIFAFYFFLYNIELTVILPAFIPYFVFICIFNFFVIKKLQNFFIVL